MPTVPTYQPGQIKNDPQPVVPMSASATAASFGGRDAAALADVSKGLQDVGWTAGQIALKEQDELNKTMVRDALQKFGSEANQYLSTDVLMREGFNAANATADATKKLREFREKYAGGLTPAQKSMFDVHASDIEAQHIDRVVGFQARELKAAQKQSLAAEAATAIDTAMIYRDDPKMLDHTAMTVVQNTRALHAGAGEAVQNLKAKEALNALYSNVAVAKARDSAEKGLAFLSENSSRFDPKQFEVLRDQFEQKAKSEAANAEAFRLASVPGMTEEQARKTLDESKLDVQSKELAMQMVKTRLSEQRAARTMQERDASESAWKALIQNPSANVDPSLPADVQKEMLAYKVTAARRALGEQTENAYAQLLPKVAAGEYVNLYPFAANLSQHDFQFLLEMQQRTRKGQDTASEALFKKALDDARRDAGQLAQFRITEDDRKDNAKVLAKEAAIDRFVAEYSKELRAVGDPSKLTPEFAEQTKANLIKDVVIKHRTFWFNEKAPAYEVRAGRFAGANIPSIRTPEEHAALPKGTMYFDQNDGKTKRKQ